MVALPVLLANAAGEPARRPAPAAEGSSPAVDFLATPFPLLADAQVERWLTRFRNEHDAAFRTLLEGHGAYEQLIRSRLRERGMPQELVYLPMLESGLSNRAVSEDSAAGLWQFMTPTAQQYGLRVDEWVDERRDPVRATDAALAYLAFLHERYGSWYVAATAYNAGPGTVDRLLRQHAAGLAEGEDPYWQIVDHLPRETRDYVPRLVAAALLAEDLKRDAVAVHPALPYRYERVFVPGGTSLARVAGILKVEAGTLRNLNPHFIQGVTPPGETYPIRVPPGLAGRLVASLASVGRARRGD